MPADGEERLMMDQPREGYFATDPRLVAHTAERSPAVDQLLAALSVVWTILVHLGLPASLALVINTAEALDVFSPFIDATLHRRLGALGLLLSVGAAIVTTESVARLGRPFGIGKFVVTAAMIGVAAFPFLTASHRVTFGLGPNESAVVLSYAYLALKLCVGVLIGATVSWVLYARPVRMAPRRA
jgi:hypothetical protein